MIRAGDPGLPVVPWADPVVDARTRIETSDKREHDDTADAAVIGTGS